MDRSESFNGQAGPLSAEVTAALFRAGSTAKVVSYIYGLGGRDYRVEDAKEVFSELEQAANGTEVEQFRYIGLRSR